jgi:RimJ/RimL family protein N-acetyltransferase
LAVLIETERLHLRALTSDDLDDLVALHAEPAVERFMGSLDRPRLIEWLSRVERDWSTYGYSRMAMVDRTTDRLIGRTGLKRWPEFDETEVGWVLHPGAWGRGFATEGARACAQWGFENLDLPYLTAMIRPANLRSIAVAQRLGMTPLRADILMGDSVVVYAVASEAWAPGADEPDSPPVG